MIEVSGRLYPVELRYRPVRQELAEDEDAPAPARSGRERDRERMSGDEERDLIDAIVDAVDECARHGPGDVLVFLPGEREIRESAEALRKHHPVGTEVLPLYARACRRPSRSRSSIRAATRAAWCWPPTWPRPR